MALALSIWSQHPLVAMPKQALSSFLHSTINCLFLLQRSGIEQMSSFQRGLI